MAMIILVNNECVKYTGSCRKMAPSHNTAKLMSLRSFNLIGQMRENKMKKDNKRKRQFIILIKVAQF